MLARLLVVPVLLVSAVGQSGQPPRVEILATPDGGIQPQAVVDGAGTIHVIYFKGAPGSGDLFYVSQTANAQGFSAPLRVNSEADTAIATGSVRGGQIALGRNGRIHVAWNGAKAVERDGVKATPMWYARLSPGGRAFEPQRAFGHQTRHLDGGGTVAADSRGHVHVVWHAAGPEDGEPKRRIYVATSKNDGERFDSEKAFAIEGGACGCCALEAFAGGDGRLQILYRAAAAMVHRDAMWTTIGPAGLSAPIRLQPWELPACPMTTFTMAGAPGGIVAAWETAQQIHMATLNPDSRSFSTPVPLPGSALRKHPSVAVNRSGQRLIAWTEGTAWARGGTLAWALQDRTGVQLASAVDPGPVPVWGLVSAVAKPDGSFVILR